MSLLEYVPMRALLAVLIASTTLIGCSKKSDDGLPPASEWTAAPSAGMDMGRLQGGGGAMPPGHPGGAGALPPGHPGGATMPPGHPPVPSDHPTMPSDHPPMQGDGTVDVTQMGLEGPDPNRKIDPSRRIKGVLKAHAKAKSRMKDGTPVFVVAKKRGADGKPEGPPLATVRLEWKDNLEFELTEANAMIKGTELVGEVVVTARYDQDSEALSKQSGDVSGQTRVKIPADGVVISLDDVIP